MRDAERVHRVFVAEEVEEVVPAAPGQATQAQRAGLMGAQEDRLGGPGSLAQRDAVEGVDGGDLTVIEGVDALPVRHRHDRREVRLAKDRATEDLVAFADARPRQGHDLVLDDIEEPVEEHRRVSGDPGQIDLVGSADVCHAMRPGSGSGLAILLVPSSRRTGRAVHHYAAMVWAAGLSGQQAITRATGSACPTVPRQRRPGSRVSRGVPRRQSSSRRATL